MYSRILKELKQIYGRDIEKYFIETNNPEFGDFTLTILMQKDYKKNFREHFEKIKQILLDLKFVDKVELKGLFVNIFLKPEYLLKKNFELKKENKLYLIEYSSPNSNKPLHLGHLRNTILGDVLANLFSKKYSVLRFNLINDRGVHICKSMLGYLKYSKFKSPEEAKMKPDHFVGYCYVLFSQEEKKNPKLTKEAEEMLRRWENKDPEVIALWKKMRNWALSGLKETYKKINVRFDKIDYESRIYNKGKKIILEAYKKGIVRKDENGNYYVKLKKYKLPDKIVLRKDNTSIYITQDIGLVVERYKKYNFNKMVYCIGSEQNLYMQQLFKVLKELGFKFYNKLEHFSYGMIYLPSGKMKSREGTVVDLDNFLEDVEAKVKEIMLNKKSKIDEKLVKKISLAAVNYFILKYDPKKDFVFDFNKSLSFEGDSGPYLLYTYVRINSLIKKMNRYKFKKVKSFKFFNDDERVIARLLLKKNYKIYKAIEKRQPHILLYYILDLANRFNSLYSKERFITNKFEMRYRYLFLTKFKEIFEEIFEILKLPIVERM